MYYLNEDGERVYTMKKVDPNGHPTLSAHPGIIDWLIDWQPC